ncbi:MAG: Ig-like domain-containing protein, partial [Actinomycetota bacterium]
GATLEVDVAGTAQGTEYDHLSVGGAATLDGTVAVVPGAGFDPQDSDSFQVLTSASRTGTFAALTGATLPSGKSYALDYPDTPNFGARLLVVPAPPSPAPICQDVAITTSENDAGSAASDCADADSDALSYAIVDQPAHGAAAVVGGELTYEPAMGFSGTDAFTYMANDGALDSNVANVAVTVNSDDVVVTDCGDPALATLTTVEGDLTIEDIADCDEVSAPNLTEVTGNLNVDNVEVGGSLDLTGVNVAAGNLVIGNLEVGGSLDLTGVNVAAGSLVIGNVSVGGDIDLSGNVIVGGDVSIEGNGEAEVIPPTDGTVGGDLTLESTGTGNLTLGSTDTIGNLTLEGTGYDELGGTTAEGDTTIQNTRGDATMRVHLPDGTFEEQVAFTITRRDPDTLPAENGTSADGTDAVIDPLAAYSFDFAVPTLNADATLTFDIHLDGLDAATRDALLAALDAGTATMATQGDDAGATYLAFPLCVGTQIPTADGCVLVELLDAEGNPTAGTPTTVRFSNVVGHFSTWAVAIVEPIEQPEPNIQEANDRLAALEGEIRASALNDALKTDLANWVRRAKAKLKEGDIAAACQSLNEFITRVDAKADNPLSRLDRATGDAWIAEAWTIKALMGC